LKPDNSKDPEIWDHYDPDDFYEATSQEMLDKAKTTKFDKNFFNFEDPTVLLKFSNPNDTRIWKETYGFDFACIDDGLYMNGDRCRLKAHQECLKETKSEFAKSCRKDSGFFKCCYRNLGLSVFIETREILLSKGLVKKHPAEEDLPYYLDLMPMTFYCTYRDSKFNVRHRFMSPEINAIGGSVMEPYEETKTRIGFRALSCGSLNLCHLKQFYLGEKQHLVTSKKELCELERNFPDVDYDELKVDGVMETEAECMKRHCKDLPRENNK